MHVQPYLNFNGRCEEALAFYKTAIGAEVQSLLRFSDSPEPTMSPPEAQSKVMHCSFKVGESTLFASDGRCSGAAKFEGVTLSIIAKSPDEAERLFGALGQGGQVQMPLTKTFFSPAFGMLADRFGLSWMVVVM